MKSLQQIVDEADGVLKKVRGLRQQMINEQLQKAASKVEEVLQFCIPQELLNSLAYNLDYDFVDEFGTCRFVFKFRNKCKKWFFQKTKTITFFVSGKRVSFTDATWLKPRFSLWQVDSEEDVAELILILSDLLTKEQLQNG